MFAHEKDRPRGCLKSCLIVLLLAVVGAGAFSLFVWHTLRTADHPQPTHTQTDFFHALRKTGVIVVGDIADLHLLNIDAGQYVVKGRVDVDQVFTKDEITALLDATNTRQNAPFYNFVLHFDQDNEVTVYAKASEHVLELLAPHFGLDRSDNPWIFRGLSFALRDKPVFLKMRFDVVAHHHVVVDVKKAGIGRFVANDAVLRIIRFELERLINGVIRVEHGFFIDRLTVDEQGFAFRGTLPETIEPIVED